MDDSGRLTTPRYSVGTHHRVWWFWLPLILGGIAMLSAMVLLPVARPVGVLAGTLSVGLLVWAAASYAIIIYGRRWLEFDDDGCRVIDRNGVFEFTDEQVSDLAAFQILHHAGGRLIAVSRETRLWIDAPQGPKRIRLVTRLSPHSNDPLEELIDRLRDRIMQLAAQRLLRRECVEGENWSLDAKTLSVSNGKSRESLPVESVAAVETVGQEVRIWREGRPRAVVTLPLSGRNTWMLPRILPMRAASDQRTTVTAVRTAPVHPLGRILFERTTGPAVSVLFVVLGTVIVCVSLIATVMLAMAAAAIGVLVGVLFAGLGVICLIAGFRVRHVRFSCHEHGLERVTLTGRQVLKFSEIDVFSFESRRNHSHGRYTGTTYTLVFADRTREQGRGIFFSTTVRNTDEELELLRDRVSERVARKMAATFARTTRVQWTTELWFHQDVLEFSRPRRFLAPPKLTVIPYDAVTDFEVRDGRFYLWTNYQERAIVNVKTSSANFYPGLIVLEGMVNAHSRAPVDEWTPSATMS